jgi:hypothetical protein
MAAVLVLLLPLSTSAQDLEPKAYSASPVGAAFLVTGIGRSTGAIVVDPTLPISDVDAKINAAFLAGGYTFGMFGQLALVTAAVPYSWGNVSGVVGEDAREVSRSGLADLRLKFSINVVGNRAMRAREYVRAPRRVIVGTSLTVAAPSGQYSGAKLVNLGTNRWSVKPEFGVSVPRGRWDLDGYLGVWLFTNNSNYYPGDSTRSQDPVVALQGHASYTLRPRAWVAFDATWYAGGGSQVEGGQPARGMNNARLGATLSFPMGRQQSFKVSYSSGVAVRSGTNFRTLSVGWQWLRLTKL